MIDDNYKYLLKEYTEMEIAYMIGGHLQEQEAPGIPSSNVGSGYVAGLGIGPAGEPGVKPQWVRKHKKNALASQEDLSPIITMLRRVSPQIVSENHDCGCSMGKFAGHDTFIVPGDMFLNAKQAKKRRKHWKTYIGEGEHGQAIRQYNRKHRGKKPIILQCERTGALCYAQYGKK